MKPLLAPGGAHDLESPWWVFRSVRGRNAAAAYYRRRGWYTLLFTDVQGPALHASRRWFTSPPGTPGRVELVGR